MSTSPNDQNPFGIFAHYHGAENLKKANEINRKICEDNKVPHEERKDYLKVKVEFYAFIVLF